MQRYPCRVIRAELSVQRYPCRGIHAEVSVHESISYMMIVDISAQRVPVGRHYLKGALEISQ